MKKNSDGNYQISKLDRLDTFVLSGVITILLTRAFLAFTGYPQIGSDSLHVAHVLYGGAILVIAFLFLLLSNKPNLHVIALFGGIGFGLFIDEIGKFLTQDNDYFYQPTIGIIYISFLLIWFITRFIIAKNDKIPFISPAEWPPKKWQINLIIIWSGITAVANIVYLPLLLAYGITEVTSFVQLPTIGIATSVLFGLSIFLGLKRYHEHKIDAASHDIRGSMIFSIVAVFPFYFLNHPVISSALLIPVILIIIGLSEVSFLSIIKKLRFRTQW